MTSHDLQAERTLVLTLVANPAAYDRCGDLLERFMFVDDQAARIYDAVQRLLFSAQTVNAVSVQAELVKGGKGGSVLPTWNRGATVGDEEVSTLAQRVREMWARREVEALASRLPEIASARGSQAAAAEAAEALAKIQTGGGRCRSMLELTAEYMTELQRDMSDPQARVAFETGFERYDRHTGGLRPGLLTVIAARPGVGKSSFVMGMAQHLAKTGVPVGMFWLEDDWRDACRRYHSARNFVAAEDLRGNPRLALQAMNEVALRRPEEQERIFVDDTHGLTVNEITARMRRMVREKGVRVFFADHLGEMRIEKDDRWGDRHDLALGKAARQFRDTAKELKAAPVLCSQMNRQVERRAEGTARMSDLDGSGQVEQAARVIAFLSKPEDEQGNSTGEFHVHLAKNTNGIPGLVKLKWDAAHMTIGNL